MKRKKQIENVSEQVSYSGLAVRTAIQTLFTLFLAGVLLTAFVLFSFPSFAHSLYDGTGNIKAQYFYANKSYLKATAQYAKMPDGEKKQAYEREVLVYYHVKALDSAILCMNEAIDKDNKRDISFYAGRVNRLVLEYTDNNSVANAYTVNIDNTNRLLAVRRLHPQVTNYDGYIRSMRTRALYWMLKTGTDPSTIQDPEQYATYNFLLMLELFFSGKLEGGMYYKDIRPLKEIAEDPNLKIDTSMIEYINCLLTEIKYSTANIYEQHLFVNIVDPSNPLEQDIERHIKTLSDELKNILEPSAVPNAYLLTALHLNRTIRQLSYNLYCVYQSYNALMSHNSKPWVNNLWTSEASHWADNYNLLLQKYELIG